MTEETTAARTLTMSQWIHATGWGLFGIGLFGGARWPGYWSTVFMMLSGACFIAGFLTTVWPSVRARWQHPAARAAHVPAHAVILVLSILLARNEVAAVLQLPPQDFDIAVSLMSLLTYLVLWWLVIASLACVIGLTLLVKGFFSTKRGLNQLWLLSTAAGAIAFGVTAALALQDGIDRRGVVTPLIEWTAYWGDYHRVERYPGAEGGERVRLHENGIVSVARVVDGKVLIQVKRLP